jgi:hypothetical protein
MLKLSANDCSSNEFIEPLNDRAERPYQTNWLVEKIHPLVVTDTPAKELKIHRVNPDIQESISYLNTVDSQERKSLILGAAGWVVNDTHLTIDQMVVSLRIIERVALSRRISTLNGEQLYGRIVDGNKNHTPNLEAIERYISFHYPSVNVQYIDHYNSLNVISLRESLLEGESVWVVFQHPKSVHKSLLKVTQDENQEVMIYIWDSLGCHYKFTDERSCHNCGDQERGFIRNLHFLLEVITREGSSFHSVVHIDKIRQSDTVNCASFVLFDFETALELEANDQSYFSSEEQRSVIDHPNFFTSTQKDYERNVGLISEAFRRQLNNHDNRTQNAHAVIYSAHLFKFLMSHEVQYPAADYIEPGSSGSDEEDNGCCIS